MGLQHRLPVVAREDNFLAIVGRIDTFMPVPDVVLVTAPDNYDAD